MKTTYQIAVLPGDGIGQEVMASATEVLAAVGERLGVHFALERYGAGAQHFLDHGVALPERTLRACEAADAILFGAMGLPHVRSKDGTEVAPQLDLRIELDLYAGVRPVRTFKGLQTPLAHPMAEHIDLVLVRESTEGLFYARGRGDVRTEDGVQVAVYDTMKISRAGTSRICDFAFRLAERRSSRKGRPGRVTSVDKANVFTSMALWRRVFEEVASRHPSVVSESAYVDATALNLVSRPWQFDVLVTENMFGDILSDLIAALVGGMGMAPSADIGDHHALFQPAHGTAPDIAGLGLANPSAMILSAAMMLEWMAEKYDNPKLLAGATEIDTALQRVFADDRVRPKEFGGSSSTAEITRAVIEALRRS